MSCYLLSWVESGRCRCAGQPQSNDRARYIGGYFGFAIGFVVMTMCRSILNLYSAWRASREVRGIRPLLCLMIGSGVTFSRSC